VVPNGGLPEARNPKRRGPIGLTHTPHFPAQPRSSMDELRNSLLHRCVLRILVEKQNKTTLFKVTVGITKIVLGRRFCKFSDPGFRCTLKVTEPSPLKTGTVCVLSVYV